MHLRYAARDGGELLREAARAARNSWLGTIPSDGSNESEPLARMFSLRQEFALAWQAFVESSETAVLELALGTERFPFQFRGKPITIHRAELYLKYQSEGAGIPSVSLQPDGGALEPVTLVVGGTGVLHGQQTYTNAQPGAWSLSMPAAAASALEDIVMICHYTVNLS